MRVRNSLSQAKCGDYKSVITHSTMSSWCKDTFQRLSDKKIDRLQQH